MKLQLEDGSYFRTDEGIDCAMPLTGDETNPRAWYVNPPVIEPVRTENWTGSVAEGGSTNFRDISFNPHGHGTHTECCGHITPEVFSVQPALKQQFFRAKLISVDPETINGDRVITANQIAALLNGPIEALLVRTLPNDEAKLHRNYSSSNPAYFDSGIVALLNEAGVKHFLTDLPSVDREEDGGALAFHHAFWNVPENPDLERTITELIFVPDTAADGNYLLSLTGASFVNDATPSRPIIYPLHFSNDN